MKASGCNMAGIGDRFRAARAELGLSQDGLADAVGVSKRGIQSNERQISVPGGEVICGLIRLGINANWLLTGEGPMLLKDVPDLVELEALRARPEQPPPAEIDQALLATTIEGILRARPDASPAQVAGMAVEFYLRILAMDMAKPKAA